MKKSGILYVCGAAMLLSIILTGIACSAGAAEIKRVEHAGFPDTVVNVIFSVGAFASVEQGKIGQGPPETEMDMAISMEAVRQAACGEDPTGGALYFAGENDPRATGIAVTFCAGGMVFGR